MQFARGRVGYLGERPKLGSPIKIFTYHHDRLTNVNTEGLNSQYLGRPCATSAFP